MSDSSSTGNAGPSNPRPRISNPEGHNQYKNCPSKDDPRIPTILQDYHRRNITDKVVISRLLLAEHGIAMSSSTVSRRRRALGLKGSGANTKQLTEAQKKKLLSDELAKCPDGKRGPRSIKEAIAASTGQHLTRDWITREMRRLDPAGFEARQPGAKAPFKKTHEKQQNTAIPLVLLGPNHRWTCDGLDKFTNEGFGVWGIRDVWSGKWLGLWVVPNTRLKPAIAYLYLSTVKQLGGMPIQSASNKLDETKCIYGFAKALKDACQRPPSQGPDQQFLHAIENTSIARGRSRLTLDWGNEFSAFWQAGKDIYNPSIVRENDLVNWLWSTLIQTQLDKLLVTMNNHRPRKDNKKMLPSGISPNIAYTLYEDNDGVNCLQPVDTALVTKLMEDLGGDNVARFTSADYDAKAQQVFTSTGIAELTLRNVWRVFAMMLPRM